MQAKETPLLFRNSTAVGTSYTLPFTIGSISEAVVRVFRRFPNNDVRQVTGETLPFTWVVTPVRLNGQSNDAYSASNIVFNYKVGFTAENVDPQSYVFTVSRATPLSQDFNFELGIDNSQVTEWFADRTTRILQDLFEQMDIALLLKETWIPTSEGRYVPTYVAETPDCPARFEYEKIDTRFMAGDTLYVTDDLTRGIYGFLGLEEALREAVEGCTIYIEKETILSDTAFLNHDNITLICGSLGKVTQVTNDIPALGISGDNIRLQNMKILMSARSYSEGAILISGAGIVIDYLNVEFSRPLDNGDPNSANFVLEVTTEGSGVLNTLQTIQGIPDNDPRKANTSKHRLTVVNYLE